MENDCCVYVLLSEKDHKRYIGSTSDLKRRLNQHNSGQVSATRNRRPLRLYAYQSFNRLIDARICEKKYKKSRGCFNKAIKEDKFIIIGE